MSKLKSYIQSNIDHNQSTELEINSERPKVSYKRRFIEPSAKARGKHKESLTLGVRSIQEPI